MSQGFLLNLVQLYVLYDAEAVLTRVLLLNSVVPPMLKIKVNVKQVS